MDEMAWRFSNNEVFFVKSAYELTDRFVGWPKEELWRTLWRIRVPQRCRMFLWLVLREKIMMNAKRFQHGLPMTQVAMYVEQVRNSFSMFYEIVLLQLRFSKVFGSLVHVLPSLTFLYQIGFWLVLIFPLLLLVIFILSM